MGKLKEVDNLGRSKYKGSSAEILVEILVDFHIYIYIYIKEKKISVDRIEKVGLLHLSKQVLFVRSNILHGFQISCQ